MTKLYILRHAIAEDKEHFQKSGQPDEERPLTPEGIDRLEKVSKKLADLDLKIQKIIQSPLVRSQQTATVVSERLGKVEVVTSENLRPESSLPSLVKDLSAMKEENLMIVGHEDHLSRFAMYLLTGQDEYSFMHFKKAGLACFVFEDSIVAGAARLEWLLTPKVILSL